MKKKRIKVQECYVAGFLSLDTQTKIMLKAQKTGHDVAFEELGAGTGITVIQSEERTR